MKKAAIIFAVVLFAVPVAMADNFGSRFGLLWTAQPLAKGNTAFGVRVGVADATSFVGTISHGISNTGEGRFKLGFVDDDPAQTELALGTDFKWQLWNTWNVNSQGQVTRSQHPFDFAIGPMFEWIKYDFDDLLGTASTTVWQLGFQAIGSYPVALNGGGSISPYGRLNARYESLKFEADAGILGVQEVTDEQLALGMNAGVAWRPRASVMVLYGEIQIDGNDGIFLGMDYLF